MTKTTPHNSGKRTVETQKKQERLAEALRANLKRRKSQSRVRKEPEKDTSE